MRRQPRPELVDVFTPRRLPDGVSVPFDGQALADLADAIVDEVGRDELTVQAALLDTLRRGGPMPGEHDLAWASAGAARAELLEIGDEDGPDIPAAPDEDDEPEPEDDDSPRR